MNFTKTVSCSFHLANRFASHKLEINCNGSPIPAESNPHYLGVTLDRSLTFNKHLQKTAAKVNSRNDLLRMVAGTNWGASFDVLHTTAMALCYAAAEYCAPAWHHSAHTKKLDTALNATMRIVSGCVRSTPVESLPILSGIPPPDLRRLGNIRSLASRIDTNHLLYHVMQRPNTIPRTIQRTNPMSAIKAADDGENHATRSWVLEKWNSRWSQSENAVKVYLPQVNLKPQGCHLPRPTWVKLNRLRSGYGRFKYHRWR